ncbi:MAG: hypothetical protein ACLRWP_19455 [Bilophila wadsworthia]
MESLSSRKYSSRLSRIRSKGAIRAVPLGLSIAEKYARMMNGGIEVDSALRQRQHVRRPYLAGKRRGAGPGFIGGTFPAP